MGDDTNQEPVDFTSPFKPPAPESPRASKRSWSKRKKLIIYISGGVLAALLVAGALYWLLLADDKKTQTQTKPTDQKQTQQTPATPVADATPVSYKSTKLNIELTHRKDWTMKEASDGEITITSPQTSYTGADGKSTTGVFTFKIRKGVSAAAKATIEKSIATKNSEVIAYAAPTPEQRQYTNVSYVGTKKDVFNMFIVTGSTELKAGNALAYTLPLDDDFYLIVGGYGSGGSTLSFDSVPKDFMDGGALAEAINIAESIKIF